MKMTYSVKQSLQESNWREARFNIETSYGKDKILDSLYLKEKLVLAWRIPGTAEPGGLPSMRSHRVGHD